MCHLFRLLCRRRRTCQYHQGDELLALATRFVAAGSIAFILHIMHSLGQRDLCVIYVIQTITVSDMGPLSK